LEETSSVLPDEYTISKLDFQIIHYLFMQNVPVKLFVHVQFL